MKRTRAGAYLGAALAAAAIGLGASPPPTPLFTFETGGYGNFAVALAVDGQGNTVVVGSRSYALSPFPVTDDAVEKGARSMFVAKVDARGDRLLWATYLGGVHKRDTSYSRGPLDNPTAVAVDFAGNVFAAGFTAANDFPTVNAVAAMPGGTGSDGFLTKISADGTRYVFSTYLGGAAPTALATDPIGNVYVAMVSATRLAYETRDVSAPGALGASVVAKFNAEGGLVFATRFGGGATKIAHVAVDGTGAVIAAGDGGDNSRWFVNPITTNCWQYPSGQCANPFVARLDPSGTRILFATLLGGTTQQSTLTAMALDPAGAMYVLGTTKATDFSTRGAMQPSNAGGSDYFLAKITSAGRLEASTYIGSTSDELGGPAYPLLTVDLAGRPTIVGASSSRSQILAGMDHPDVPLYVSRDDGGTWTRSDAGLQTSVYTVAVSPQDRTAYAGTADGVYRSTDDGASWRLASTGIGPAYNGALNSYQLAIDPAHAGTLYAGTLTGLYKTDNRGDTWTRIDGEPFFRGGGVQAQVVVDGNGWVYLGTLGIRRSRDGGATWTNISNGLTVGPTGRYESVSTIVFDPDAAGTIYTIQNNRLYRTTDAGETWIDQGALSPVGYESIAIPPGRPGRVFASSWDKVYRSNQGIGAWTPLDVAVARAHFAIDRQRPDTVFVSDGWTGGSIAVSRDAGETWRRLSTPIASAPVVDPLRPSSLFLPGGIRSLPFFAQLDETLTTVRYASFVDAPLPRAAVVDAAGSIYLLPGGDELVVQKVQLPQILNPSRKGSR